MSPAQTTSQQLVGAASRLYDTLILRDTLVIKRRAEGATLRQIASEAGLSHAAVAKILKKTNP